MRMAVQATGHCLIGCGIGEVLGMLMGTALGWSNGRTIVFALLLAFAFGYGLTLRTLRRSNMAWQNAFQIALAADTASIAAMEMTDNAAMLVLPGAMDAHPTAPWFWLSLTISLGLAFLATVPVNAYLISRGRGHSVMHAHHGHDGH